MIKRMKRTESFREEWLGELALHRQYSVNLMLSCLTNLRQDLTLRRE